MDPGLAIVLRRATSADAAAIRAVRAQAILTGCKHHYEDQLLQAWAHNPMPASFPLFIESEPFYVAELASTVVGVAGLKRSASELNAVFVLPEFTGKGLGMRLLRQVESVAQDLRFPLLQLSASLNSVPFYSRAGYVGGVQETYTTSSGLKIPCVHMEKRLSEIAGA